MFPIRVKCGVLFIVLFAGSLFVLLPRFNNNDKFYIPKKQPSLFETNNVTDSDCKITPLLDVDQYHQFYNQPLARCSTPAVFGGSYDLGVFDGDYFMCLDEQFNIKRNNCIVLSFGINNEWSFEDAVELHLGCKIYAFDPTMDKKDHRRSENIMFYNLGIGDVDGTMTFNEKDIKINRYETILKKLNLLDKEIDYLKIDVETSDLRVFDDLLYSTPHLLKNVKMLAAEIHPQFGYGFSRAVLETHVRSYRQLQWMKCLGFELYFSRRNLFYLYKYYNRDESCCYEIVWGRPVNIAV